ncbi:glycoside hydrolase family 2 protein [Pedobacter caeni]|uniref:beta-galactosidase n=1 Tax=Pedobacter caeni TaxID=288992 RepID=A0A1M5GE27_9SPHI|nr:glycoside hydrolase family 2 TIM barrel-domain containing protein [Pedobacter caeni]SHG01956.1 Beta galactosidase small chain [Pedobacter caeni]
MLKQLRCLTMLLLFTVGSVYSQVYKTVQNYSAADCGDCLLTRLGQVYTYTQGEIPADILPLDGKERTIFFAGRISIPFAVSDAKSSYQIKVTYLSDSKDRKVKALADTEVLNSSVALPYGKTLTVTYDIPAAVYRDGAFTFDLLALSGANVPVSRLEILSTGSKPLVYKDVLAEKIRSISFKPERLSPVPAKVENVQSPVLSLNGIWDFKYKTQAGKIQVPGEWEMQGYHVDSAQHASYTTSFELPQDWKGKKIKLRFDGVSSHCEVLLNGKLIGTHEGGFVIFEMDASTAVKAGKNKIEVKVASLTVSDKLGCVSQYAAHTVGGILRKVTLTALPELNIGEVYPQVTFDKNYEHADLHIDYQVYNESKLPADAALKFILLDREDKELRVNGNSIEKQNIRPNTNLKGILSVRVDHPEKWDTEHPYLYTLITRLMSKGKVIQENRQKLGFRQIDIRGNQFFVNNKAIKLHGANRHDVSTLSGRSISAALNKKDAELFRNANCNYIRTSHYPPAEEFLAACDSLGMFVEAEAAITWVEHHASPIWKEWNYLNPDFIPHFLRANFENIRGNRNHPSIIIWSIANESRWSPLWDKVNTEVKKYDPLRPTAFHDQTYGGFNNAGSKADIRNIHYPGLGGPEQTDKFTDRPVLFGEYCHVQTYNRLEEVTDPYVRADWGRMLHQMYDKMYTHQACLGGAIWAGIDDIFHKPDSTIVGYGPWGAVLDGWRREKPEFISVRKSYAPLIITNLKEAKPKNGILLLQLENRYNFANLKEGQFNYIVDGVSRSAVADIPARSSGDLELQVADDAKVVRITFTDPRGFVTQEEQLNFSDRQVLIPVEPAIAVKLKKSGDQLILSRGTQKYSFDKNTGLVTGDKILGGIALMVVPMNGDDGGAPHIAGNNYQRNIKPLLYQPEGNWKASSVSASKDKESVNVKVEGSYNYLKGVFNYKFLADGTIEIAYDFKVTDTVKINPRQWGLAFELPSDFQHLNYSSKGYWSVYPENDIARTSGDIHAVPVHQKYVEAALKVPAGPWSADANDLGSRDFRSTKANIYHAGLSNDKGDGLRVYSDGTQSARSWIDGNKTRFLLAELNGGGSDGFFASYYSKERRPLKMGSELKGKIKLKLEAAKQTN